MIGGLIIHDCPLSRSVGYFLELIVPIACFMKKPLVLTLRGITTDDKDLGVDLIRTITLPHLTLFGIEDGVEFKVGPFGQSQYLILTTTCRLRNGVLLLVVVVRCN